MKWWIYTVIPGGGAGNLLATTSPWVLRDFAQRIGQAIASSLNLRIVLVQARTRRQAEKALEVTPIQGQAVMGNPTLYHHRAEVFGAGGGATFHLTTKNKLGHDFAVADLYTPSMAQAKRMGQALADVTGMRLHLVYNEKHGARMASHPKANPIRGMDKRSIRTVGTGPDRLLVGCPTGHWHAKKRGRKCDVGMRRANPSPFVEVKVGQLRKLFPSGERVRVEQIQGNRVKVKNLSRISTDWMFTDDLKATSKLDVRSNPREERGGVYDALGNGVAVGTVLVGTGLHNAGRSGTVYRIGRTIVAIEEHLTGRKRNVHFGRDGIIHHYRVDTQSNPERWYTVRDASGAVIATEKATSKSEALMYAERAHAGVDDPPQPWTATVGKASRNPRVISHRQALASLKRLEAHERHGIKEARQRAKPKRNPGGRGELERATDTFRMWHGFDPEKLVPVNVYSRRMPKHLVALGKVRRIDYDSNKWEGRTVTYTHSTKRPYPTLATDPEARSLYLVGGRMKPTADGLVH